MPAPDVPAVRAALDAIAATDAAEALDAGAATRSFDGGRDWQAFCRRVAEGAATPSCVIDFPYADTGAGGLNLQGDDRLLERMVCFHDRQRGAPEAWLVVVHVHTLLRWGDRLRLTAAERLQAVTSVNARQKSRCTARLLNRLTEKLSKTTVEETGRTSTRASATAKLRHSAARTSAEAAERRVGRAASIGTNEASVARASVVVGREGGERTTTAEPRGRPPRLGRLETRTKHDNGVQRKTFGGGENKKAPSS